MREEETNPAIIADELNDYLTGDMPTADVGEFLSYLSANTDLLARAQVAAAALDEAVFQVRLPIATTSTPQPTWHSHRNRRPVRTFFYRRLMTGRSRGSVQPEAQRTRGSASPPWIPASTEFRLETPSDVHVRVDSVSVGPGDPAVLVRTETGETFESVIKYDSGELIARFATVPAGRYTLEVSTGELDE